ncbi:hypothetical protein BRD20_05245 [Halobacteriales archaeon SW_8_65_20]|nr:MAG: hypothetical protein BRD20_05245 [Halobacteriales archaeon SW_8_65_20]
MKADQNGDMAGPRRPLRDRFGRGLVAVLALALVVSSALALPALGSPASSEATAETDRQPVVPQTDTAAYLAIDSERVETSQVVTVGLDPAGASAVTTARLRGEFETSRLRERFTAAATEDARRLVIENTTARLDAAIADLEARQQAALDAYNAGAIPATAFVRELVAIDTKASKLGETVDQLYTYDSAVGTPVPEREIARLKSRLIPLQGPVRDRLATHVADGNPRRVHLTTAADGLVLSTIIDGEFSTRYLREALVGSAFDDRFADKPISITEDFVPRLEELYPWVFGSDRRSNTALTNEPYYVQAGVYGMAVSHPQGSADANDLVVYYDADTDAIFREIQRKDVAAVPTESVTTAEDGYRLVVETTHADGPLGIRVENTTTGDAVESTVYLDGDPLGITNRATHWTVTPRRPFSVTVTTPTGNLTTTVGTDD